MTAAVTARAAAAARTAAAAVTVDDFRDSKYVHKIGILGSKHNSQYNHNRSNNNDHKKIHWVCR